MKTKQYWSVYVADYHAFKNALDFYKAAGLKNVNYVEVGCNGQYEAVFWVGKKPINYIKERKDKYRIN